VVPGPGGPEFLRNPRVFGAFLRWFRAAPAPAQARMSDVADLAAPIGATRPGTCASWLFFSRSV